MRKKEEMIGIVSTANKKDFLISRTIDWAMNDVYLLKEDGTIKPICVNLNGLFSTGYIDGQIYAYTNYNAPKGKIVKIDPENRKTRTRIAVTIIPDILFHQVPYKLRLDAPGMGIGQLLYGAGMWDDKAVMRPGSDDKGIVLLAGLSRLAPARFRDQKKDKQQ